jgi:acetyl/propionyl-CoA carboxylase alpha subunit
LERALLRPRHIEVQIFGDRHGNLIHLGERECSIQRRHQKVVEETPSTALDERQRQAICEAAVAVAHAAGYDSAGTVEFLLDGDGRFYFLEMNTRLQVEHPLTELVSGLDLVEWQIRIANGERLPWRQEDVHLKGHAIEARLYAEDPSNDYLPVPGRVALFRPPVGEGIRVDSGIRTGDEITIHYDPLLAKVIAWGSDHETAVRRLQRALEETVLFGLTTNLPLLSELIRHPAFVAGALHTAFLAEHLGDWRPSGGDVATALIAATLAQWRSHPQHPTNRDYWRNNPNGPALYRYQLPLANGRREEDGSMMEVRLQPLPRVADQYLVSLSNKPEKMVSVCVNEWADSDILLTIDGHRQWITLSAQGSRWWMRTEEGVVVAEALSRFPEPRAAAAADSSLRAPMPGSVLAVLVEVGQLVEAGQPLVKMEAMKMEHTIHSDVAGMIAIIYYTPGATVEANALLLAINPS